MEIKRGAVSDGKYRYQLSRIWDETKPLFFWLMHNPSTADGEKDDPTIRRLISFTQRNGGGGFYVGNLMPYRATKPKDLKGVPYNELYNLRENLKHIEEMAKKCSRFVIATGIPVRQVIQLIPNIISIRLDQWECLKIVGGGFPGHPLFIKGDTELMPYDICKNILL